eukprot:352610-Chlamydomonas_euryale.AAC.11
MPNLINRSAHLHIRERRPSAETRGASSTPVHRAPSSVGCAPIRCWRAAPAGACMRRTHAANGCMRGDAITGRSMCMPRPAACARALRTAACTRMPQTAACVGMP